jgi:hypothetical protein
MSYITNTIPSRAVTGPVGPVTVLRGANYLALGALKAEPWLKRYPNGRPRRSLSGYENTPFLKTYVNGRPMESIPGGSTPKQALVIMALNTAMTKKCGGRTVAVSNPGATAAARGARGQSSGLMMRSQNKLAQNNMTRRGMRGLGDDGGDESDDDLYDDVVSSGVSSVQDNINTTNPLYETTGYTPSGALDVPGTASGTIPAMSTIAGSPTSGSSNPLSSLLNSLLGSSNVNPNAINPLTGLPYGYGATGLSSPLYAGASISTGAALMIGGVVLLVAIMSGTRTKR